MGKTAKDLGYTVGDRFKLKPGQDFAGDDNIEVHGDIADVVVELAVDDGTDCPWFRFVSGATYHESILAAHPDDALYELACICLSWLQRVADESGANASAGTTTIDGEPGEQCLEANAADVLSITKQFCR